MWLKISLFVILVGFVQAKKNEKSSVAFVIDDTSSMTDDIDAVKENTNIIFDAVHNSNDSQIDNFVLVTFNDPTFEVLAVTKDRNTFKDKLAPIYAHNVINDECEEYSMSGIEKALEVSHTHSFIYVFTDATARDYWKLEKVQSLAVKKQSQVSFLLTGHCAQSKTEPEYKAFYTLSKATGGQVFQMTKSNVGEVLKFVAQSIESKKTLLTVKTLPPGHHNINIPVDSTIKNTTFVLASDPDSTSKLKVLNPSGGIAVSKSVVDIPGTTITEVLTPVSGNYTAVVDSSADTKLTVTGKTSFDFDYGFSVFKTTYLNATSTRPLPDINSHILIKLETTDKNIKLNSIDIIDLDGSVITKLYASILDDSTKTYVVHKFMPPTNLFKIAINAQHNETGEELTRYSNPIEPQKQLVPPYNKSPTVEILEGLEVTSPYNKPLQLTCKISGYPRPTVVWEDTDSGKDFASTFSEVEPPYDYVSTLDLPAVENDGKYRCKATINGVTDTKDVEVSVKKIFEVIETPESIYKIEYNKKADIPCKVNADPPATVTWYFEDKTLTNKKYMDVSDEKLSIRHMTRDMVGKYSCEIKNAFNSSVTNFTVYITGFERPVISKDNSLVTVLEGSDATLTCRLLAGKPKPKVTWRHMRKIWDSNFELHNGNTTLIIRNVNREYSGRLVCAARNVAGSVRHNILLNVEYPPTIRKGKTNVILKGDSNIIHCSVDGNPKPHVVWTLNDKHFIPDKDRKLYRDHSLKLRSSMENSGTYKCEAKNKHGSVSRTIKAEYAVPVSIQIPDRSTFDTRVGEDIQLPCIAKGYPTPTIEWTFLSSEPGTRPKMFKADKNDSLSLRNLQLNSDGYYFCNASNIDGATNITYTIHVNDPPVILNVDKTIYKAVEGDLVLRIPCKATGRPKPDIQWFFNGFSIAKGTDWNDIEKDGTLLIKNVDIKSRGEHTCMATNSLGVDNKSFLVDVSKVPYDELPYTHVLANKGENAVVNCTLPQSFGSTLKWYKDGNLISNGDLVITNVSIKDSGVYTCRVSGFAGAQSRSFMVIVTSGPEFDTYPETTIDFQEDEYAELDCTNKARPQAKTAWYFKGNKINTDDDIYYNKMTYSNIGKYSCIVSNDIGTITRTFVIKTRGCAVHIQDDLTGNLPLISLPYDLSVKTVDGLMYIPENNRITLSCPTMFTKIPKSLVIATCKKESDFDIDGNVYKISDLKCTTPSIPEVVRKGIRCGYIGTEAVDIGFTIDRKFTAMYQVCVDMRKNIPVYATLKLPRTGSGVDIKDPVWFDNKRVPFDFSTMYQCDRQTVEISRTLNKYFHARDRCCFGRRQLVSPKDMMPGLSQVATYSNLNIVPQWSTCKHENWNDMEDRVRSLATEAASTLLVSTGQADQLSLPDSSRHNVNITLTDGRNQQPVPKYLWKVIQDEDTKSSVAIVQVNIPDLKQGDARRHVLCDDVCDRIPWLNGGAWKDVTKGYIYCCRIMDFERAFDFTNQFSRGRYNNLLTSASFTPINSLT